MKYMLLFLLLTILAPQVYAEDIITGNASSYVKIENKTSGGSVNSSVLVEVNGEKKEFNSDKEGTLEVKVTSEGSTTGKSSITPGNQKTKVSSSSAKIKKQVKKQLQKNEAFLKVFFERFESLFKSFFK